MDTLIETITLLIVKWRVGLVVVLSCALAVVLASWLEWFTGAYGLALALAGVAGGIAWEGLHDSRTSQPVPSDQRPGTAEHRGA